MLEALTSPTAVRGSEVRGHMSVQRATDISEQLDATMKRLQEDVRLITKRLDVLEKHHNKQQRQVIVIESNLFQQKNMFYRTF